MRMEHRLGRGQPRRRVGREQAQAAECRLDRAAHRIVHAHLLHAACHHVWCRLAGRGVGKAAGILLDEQRMIGAHVKMPGL